MKDLVRFLSVFLCHLKIIITSYIFQDVAFILIFKEFSQSLIFKNLI